jgi:hypothetical protein
MAYPGAGPNPKLGECNGRWIGVGWASVVDDRTGGLIPDPQKWKDL